jgi:hypothetical protein
VSRVPKPPKFKEESDRYFFATYDRAIDSQHHIVLMDNWYLGGIRHDHSELMRAWQDEGLGRIIVEKDGYGSHTNFSISEKGFAHGARLRATYDRRRLLKRLARNLWPALNGVAAIIAAVAAIAAAYYSYLSLQK